MHPLPEELEGSAMWLDNAERDFQLLKILLIPYATKI